MREHVETDYVVTFETGEVTLEDKEGRSFEPSRVQGGGAHLRVPIEDVEGLVAAASAYRRMFSELRDVDVLKGPQIEEDGSLVRIGNLPTFKFASGPFFESHGDVLVDGAPAVHVDEDCNWTEVTIWDYGRGITFRTPDDQSLTLCVGASLDELKAHLEVAASTSPTP